MDAKLRKKARKYCIPLVKVARKHIGNSSLNLSDIMHVAKEIADGVDYGSIRIEFEANAGPYNVEVDTFLVAETRKTDEEVSAEIENTIQMAKERKERTANAEKENVEREKKTLLRLAKKYPGVLKK